MANLTYNNYTFDEDAVWFTINKRGIIGRTGRRNLVAEQWVIHGRVNGADVSAVNAKIALVEAAMVDGGDLVFSLGSHSLLSSNCTEGTHVRLFSWLPGYDGVHGSGAENVLRRSFRMIIDGITVNTADTDIIEWHESVFTIGTGGPIIVPSGSLAGIVEPQQIQAYTHFITIQSGYGVGLTTYPIPASPIWRFTGGVYYEPLQCRSGPATPSQWGINQNTGYRWNWNYQCWSTFPLTGLPTLFT